jgi:hypothetical protein
VIDERRGVLGAPGRRASRGKIIQFPGTPPQLQLDGHTLIAWRLGPEGEAFGEADWYYAIWKPADGRGWYESGYYVPDSDGGGSLISSRSSRAHARSAWHNQCKNLKYRWHYLMSEAEAFPEKRMQYVRPPRGPMRARG